MATTPNIGLNLPARDDRNWDDAINQNFNIIDSALGEFSSGVSEFIYVDGHNVPTIQAAHDALPTSGGTIMLPPGNFDSAVTTVFSKKVVIIGSGRGQSTIRMTSTGTSLHAITAKDSITLRDLSFVVTSPPSTNLSMKALNVDTATYGGANLKVVVENVDITGFNLGLFADGRGVALTGFGIDQLIYRNCRTTISGQVNVVSECYSAHGCVEALIENCLGDNNFIGDHIVYVIRNQNITVRNCVLKNTAGTSGCAIKATTENATGGATFNNWRFEANDISNVILPILVSPEDASKLQNLVIAGNVISDANSTNGNEAAILIAPVGTSTIDNILFSGNKIEDVQVGVVLFACASGASIGNATFVGEYYKNWSQTSSGTYAAINSASLGTYSQISLWGVRADGASAGHSALPAVGSFTFSHVQVGDCVEVNVGTPTLNTYTYAISSGCTLAGKITKYNNVITGGQGVSPIYGGTLQKSETAADSGILTVTPPSSAGQYRINFSLSVSAQSSATLGWTATWKDANGSAQAPTNLAIFTVGSATVASTVTAATNGCYYGSIVVDIDNSGTAIQVKLTFSGTSFTAKASATVQRLQ